jgi:hypothetical protein
VAQVPVLAAAQVVDPHRVQLQQLVVRRWLLAKAHLRVPVVAALAAPAEQRVLAAPVAQAADSAAVPLERLRSRQSC